MRFEYHGWVALAASQEDWSDSDFEDAFQQVAKVLTQLRPDEGHEPLLADCDLLPRMLYLKGVEVKSLDVVFQVIETVGRLFDRAYGELSVIEGELSARWDSSTVVHYFLIRGTLKRGEQKI
jgi:hypothetical protein